jgi:hypothetical protein
MHQITAYPQVSGALAHTRRGPSVRQRGVADRLGVSPGPQVARPDRREQRPGRVQDDGGARDERLREVPDARADRGVAEASRPACRGLASRWC